ncbi:MAG: phosphorylated adapter RNA export RNA-binding domain-containing protein [Anaerolineae bacterium]|nr:phosphorylated adapter RNA export RNA-binding domain-containing protein [Anaerolineae bacterium]
MLPEEIKAYVEEVAKKLGETDKKPLEQIELLIEHVGKEVVAENLAEAVKIEADGGMMTEDKKRRRTIGGVFFYIIKAKLDPKIRARIFPGYGQNKKHAGKVIAWDERLDYVKPLLEEGEHGGMRFVVMTLHGRPGKVVIEGDSVMTTIAHTHGKTPLPRGVPHPPEDVTLYTVYMGHKQWEGVTESLEKYKSDRLIIEGSIFYDKETETIAILATRVSTKRIDKMAQRDADKANQKEAKPKKGALPPKKQAKQGQQGKVAFPQKPMKPMKPIPQRKPPVDVDIPEGTPPEVAAKLKQLHSAAATLRERIAAMEEKGQSGVNMTKKLLMTTEKQIESLEKQFTK